MCVTSENKEKAWLNFEAGLIAKAISTNRVCPVLLDVTQPDITGPLTLFQMKETREKDDMLGLVLSINKNLEQPRTEAKVQVAFEKFWQNLVTMVEQINPASTAPQRRDALEVAEESLILQREQNKAIAEQSAMPARIEASTKRQVVPITGYNFKPATEMEMEATFQDVVNYINQLNHPTATKHIADTKKKIEDGGQPKKEPNK